MAKNQFTNQEREIWRAIYGNGRGPSSGRVKILVEDFAREGLWPILIRVEDDGDEEWFPWSQEVFKMKTQIALRRMADHMIQVYYHPAELERRVGSTSSTWIQWAKKILELEGLTPAAADENDPHIRDNLPKVRLTAPLREHLKSRNLPGRGYIRPLSLRMVAFFIAAQYEAWASPAQVSLVAPFQEALRRVAFPVRTAEVRRDGSEDLFKELSVDAEADAHVDSETNGSTNHIVEDQDMQSSTTPIIATTPPEEETPSAEEDDVEIVRVELLDGKPKDFDRVEKALEAEIASLRERERELREEQRRLRLLRRQARWEGGKVECAAFREDPSQEHPQLISLRLEDGTEHWFTLQPWTPNQTETWEGSGEPPAAPVAHA